jgi:hypothetical protein
MNEVEGCRVDTLPNQYRNVTLGEEQDQTQEEIISIEDTYRETAAAGLINSQNAY